MKFLIFILILVSNLALAQEVSTEPSFPTEDSEVVPEMERTEKSPAIETVEEAKPLPQKSSEVAQAPKRTLTSQEVREHSTGTVMVGYQLISSWLPSKKTIGYTHVFNKKWTLEGEFSFQNLDVPFIGVDLGEIKERRYTLQFRRFVGNSFNFSFGPVYSTFKARLGSDILDSFGNTIDSQFSAENLGLSGGIGNRWQWENGFTAGIDWIRLNVPVMQTKVEDRVLEDVPGASDISDIKDVIRTFNRIPTFVLLGVNIGYSF